MTLPRPVKAVIFDMDGLLIDSENLLFRAIQLAAAGIGREMPLAVFQRTIGMQHADSDHILIEHFGEGFDLAAWVESVGKHHAEESAGAVALKAGVVEILDALDALGLLRAIATSSSFESVQNRLALHGLADRFATVAAKGSYPRSKPAPDAFLKAAELLGVAPADCLALEDSHNGVRSAAGAGMMTMMVPDMLDPTEEMRTLCVRIARDLHEVRELLEAQA